MYVCVCVCLYIWESPRPQRRNHANHQRANCCAAQESHKSEDVNGRKPTVRRRNTKRNFRAAAAQEADDVAVAVAVVSSSSDQRSYSPGCKERQSNMANEREHVRSATCSTAGAGSSCRGRCRCCRRSKSGLSLFMLPAATAAAAAVAGLKNLYSFTYLNTAI